MAGQKPLRLQREHSRRNGEFGLITQAQLQHRVDGEIKENTEMKETADSFADIALLAQRLHLAEHVSVNLKKKVTFNREQI